MIFGGKGGNAMVREIIKVVVDLILSAISAFLSYLASSSLIFDKLIAAGILGSGVDIDDLQEKCLWFGIVFSAIVLTWRLIYRNIKIASITEQRNNLIKMNKETLAESLRQKLSQNSLDFDIRIFIPQHPWLYKAANKFGRNRMKRRFIIKNIDLIAEQGTTKKLKFEVYPCSQGLVGACYTQKSIVFDDNLIKTNSTEYNLSHLQITRTASLRWIICCPIFNESDDVVAIISLDGKSIIELTDETVSNLKEDIIGFSRMLYDSVPEFFRRW